MQFIQKTMYDKPSVTVAGSRQLNRWFIGGHAWGGGRNINKRRSFLPLLSLVFKTLLIFLIVAPINLRAASKNISRLNNRQVEVKGIVIHPETGAPIVGATIKIKGKTTSTVSDKDGRFTIQANTDDVIIITHIGFQPYEQKVTGSDLGKITLKISTSGLDEIQIVAYGQTSRRLNTGNTATVKAAEIEMQPVDNPLLTLTGRVPGLVITQSSGFSGSGVQVTIQGKKQAASNTDVGSDDALFVIDGVTYPSQLLSSLTGVLGQSANRYNKSGDVIQNGSGNPLSFINPADIESIEVLKDADATAIYGSQGANGVILITTKKGKAGKTKVDLNLQSGTGEIAHFIKMLNTTQYMAMRKEALKNDGRTIDDGTNPVLDYDLDGTWDTTRNTNWQKTLLGGTARYTDVEGSISGGSENTQFLVSTGYHRETTVLPGDFNDQKTSVRFNLNHVSPNQKLRLTMSAAYMNDLNHLPSTNVVNLALELAPDAPGLYQSDGTLNWQPDASNVDSWINPLAYLKQTTDVKTGNLTSSAVLSYQLLPGLVIKSDFGYNRLQTNEVSMVPLSSIAPSTWEPYVPFGLSPSGLRTSSFNDGNINSWQISPQLSYKRVVGQGTLDALAGMTQEENNSELEMRNVSNFDNDLVMDNVARAKTLLLDTKGTSTYKYNGLFGRLNYNWQDKYIVNITGRRDGSSRYGDNNKFHTFGAAGLAWIFSKENIVQDNLTFLSFGKIKGSYGITGSDQVNDYQNLATYKTNESYLSNGNVPLLYQGTYGLTPNNLPNPYLEWEVDKKFNAGIDLGFFKDRILLSADYYDDHASNQVQTYYVPLLTGFTMINRNSPAVVRNWGWEFTATTINVHNQNFRWVTNFNLTLPQNKLTSFPDLDQLVLAFTQLGQPVGTRATLHAIGVDPTTGNFMVQGADGKPTAYPNYATDTYVKININPTVYGGFENNFQYKGFGLDFLLQFSKRKDKDILTSGHTPGAFSTSAGLEFEEAGNQPVTVLNHWQKAGDVAMFPAYTTVDASTNWANFNNSDAAYKDASFLRLKNVSLSWTLPKIWIKSVGLENARLYIQGQNIFTITKYNGFDPEVTSQGNINLPLLRVITLGAQITL